MCFKVNLIANNVANDASSNEVLKSLSFTLIVKLPSSSSVSENSTHFLRIYSRPSLTLDPIGLITISLIGILSKLSGILAENKIGIFAVSTFNTDYILVKAENFERALGVLSAEGYTVV